MDRMGKGTDFFADNAVEGDLGSARTFHHADAMLAEVL
jgi:hypothetical protein